MTGRAPGYTPFADAPPFPEDEDAPLPMSIPADELSHLNKTGDAEERRQPDANPILAAVVNFVWQGGSPGDAWLHMTAAQVLYLLYELNHMCSEGQKQDSHMPGTKLADSHCLLIILV